MFMGLKYLFNIGFLIGAFKGLKLLSKELPQTTLSYYVVMDYADTLAIKK